MTKTIMILAIATAFVAGSIATATTAFADHFDPCDFQGAKNVKKVTVADNIWHAICDLQEQINTIELTPGPPGPAGQGTTFIKKSVPNQPCVLQGAALVGWCPDGSKKLFIIRDSALISAKAVTISLQHNNIATPPACTIVLDGAGFAQMIIGCNPAPPNLVLSELVYIIHK